MTVTYRRAPEVEKIAAQVIEQHHQHLSDAVIVYLFRSEAPTKNGKLEAAVTSKMGGRPAFLAALPSLGDLANGIPPDNPDDDDAETTDPPVPPTFLIEVGRDVWEKMPARMRLAMVDHELCHIVDDGEGKLKIAAHDVEEFSAIVQRHGLWRGDLRRLIEAGVKQLELPIAETLEDVERHLAEDAQRRRDEKKNGGDPGSDDAGAGDAGGAPGEG